MPSESSILESFIKKLPLGVAELEISTIKDLAQIPYFANLGEFESILPHIRLKYLKINFARQ